MAVKNSNLDDTDYNAKDKISDSVLFQGLIDNLLKGGSRVQLVIGYLKVKHSETKMRCRLGARILQLKEIE